MVAIGIVDRVIKSLAMGILQVQEYPIWSNMFLLFPVWVGVKNKHYKSAIFLFITMIFSTVYHTCDNTLREQHKNGSGMSGATQYLWLLGKTQKKVWVCWGISYNSLQFLDFFYARLCISMICMKICVIPREHKENIFHVYYSLILITMVLNRHNVIYTGSVVSFDLLVPTISAARTLYYWCFSRNIDEMGESERSYTLAINRYRFCGCCTFFIAGIVCFEESAPSNYAEMHSLWHMFMSLSCGIALSQQQGQSRTTLDEQANPPISLSEGVEIDDPARGGEQDRLYTRERGLS